MSQRALDTQQVRQQLYERIRTDAPFEEKASDALDIGRRYLGVDNGHLTQIDQEIDHWKAIVSTDSSDGTYPEGLELDLTSTYCRRTIEENSPVALHDAPNQGWADDPAFEEHALRCYHGTTLVVDGEPCGTVCFVGDEPRNEPFSEEETVFVELLTRLLERELERERHEAELERQTNLVTVLNRVLRHNVRNDISIIRGYTELMAEKLGETRYGRIALDNIDGLIDLCRKARKLNRVVSAENEREQTELVTLVQDIVEQVESEHPDASFSVPRGEELTAAVLPSFDTAIEEIVENAAKHGGDRPEVSVTVQPVPNAAEIRIEDDGPGLADVEADVLNSGEETPLAHGSGLGLWLAYWIVTSHDGTIETETDDGTTITITVPRRRGGDVYR